MSLGSWNLISNPSMTNNMEKQVIAIVLADGDAPHKSKMVRLAQQKMQIQNVP